MNPRLDVARIEGGQRSLGHQIAVVYQCQTVRGAQPIRRLGIGDDVNMAVLGEKLFQGTQAVAQLMVVTKTPLHIAVTRHGSASVLGQLRQSDFTLGSPNGVIAIDPQVHHIDGRIRTVGGIW